MTPIEHMERLLACQASSRQIQVRLLAGVQSRLSKPGAAPRNSNQRRLLAETVTSPTKKKIQGLYYFVWSNLSLQQFNYRWG